MIQDAASDAFVLQLWHAAVPITAIVTAWATVKGVKRRNGGKPNGVEAGLAQLHRDMEGVTGGLEKLEKRDDRPQ